MLLQHCGERVRLERFINEPFSHEPLYRCIVCHSLGYREDFDADTKRIDRLIGLPMSEQTGEGFA